MPVITEVKEAARDVPLAVFSAITHSKGPGAAAILETLAAALNTVDPDTAAIFAEFTEVGLGNTRARQIWRELMTTLSYFFQSEAAQQVREEGREEGLEEGREEGRAEAQAAAVLMVLERRGLAVSPATRARITACTDLATLTDWLDRAWSADAAAELFIHP